MFSSLKKIIHALQKKEISAQELTNYYLQRIEKYKHLNAFITVYEAALDAAKKADARLQQGNAPAFTGVPIAHKDLFCTKGIRTTCASRMLAHFVPPYSATIVEKCEQAGTVLLGKTNMDEFAMGSSNENSFFGAVKNPWNLDYTPGGSSGGAAAAVAAGLVPLATGSDTGGSIRQPAAFCGISGIKPTYGLVSRYGMVAYASSFDQAGPMARSAADLALALEILVGHDPRDSTSFSGKSPSYTKNLEKTIRGVTIGVPTCFLQTITTPSIRASIENALLLLEKEGAIIQEVELGLTSSWIPCYYLIACAEASSNLARFDGMRYGHRATQAHTVQELIAHSRSEGFGPEVKKRILLGSYVLSAGYKDAYYVKALQIRRLIQQELHQALEKVDILLSPTTPTAAFRLGETNLSPLQSYLSDICTVAANLAGLPALSIPCGLSETGLPLGMQFLGNPFQDGLLLNIAHQYQLRTDWHQHGDLLCP
jgi:aspartyl-tRNA(Asn)/glutamyl-tRNA(Gln) amidotransferase subunit A